MKPILTKSILFSTPMVEALLAGRKSCTRRIIKPQPEDGKDVYIKPRYEKGDILWVREKWRLIGWNWDDGEMLIEYGDGIKEWVPAHDPEENSEWLIEQIDSLVAKDIFMPDPKDEELPFIRTDKLQPWKSPIYLPSAAARIFLKVTDIKVERACDISEEDAVKEGVEYYDDVFKDYSKRQNKGVYCAAHSFRSLFESINGADSWEKWVWAYSFTQIDK